MKKKGFVRILALILILTLLTACGGNTAPSKEETADTEQTAEETGAAEENAAKESEAAENTAAENEAAEGEAAEETTPAEVPEETESEAAEGTPVPDVTVRVGSLKGPTTMGLVGLMAEQEGLEEQQYTFEMAAAPDELLPRLASGELDIALIPANAASILYNKTKGGIVVIDINTLGVLQCVTGDETIASVKDLAGKTVMTTGQGATPEFALRYLLEKNGVTDCTLEFKSEATEVAAYLAEDPSRIAVLPQPFVTAALMQNEALRSTFSLTDEWDAVSEDSRMVTGVTVVRKAFLEDHPQAVEAFLEAHEASTVYTTADPEMIADLIEKYGIVAKAQVALKALPECSIVCIRGEEMKAALSGYLEVLFNAAPESVGGALPGDDFYYAG